MPFGNKLAAHIYDNARMIEKDSQTIFYRKGFSSLEPCITTTQPPRRISPPPLKDAWIFTQTIKLQLRNISTQPRHYAGASELNFSQANTVLQRQKSFLKNHAEEKVVVEKSELWKCRININQTSWNWQRRMFRKTSFVYLCLLPVASLKFITQRRKRDASLPLQS